MKQYLDLVREIINNGVEKQSGRSNMPNIIGISNSIIKMNLQDGFPLLTTKKMYWKGVIHELLWFLRGEYNIKYLVDNNVNIWNKDSYRWYKTEYIDKHNAPDISMDEFLDKVRSESVFLYPVDDGYCMDKYVYGDVGKVYGYQWRNQNGVDQIKDIIEGLKTNPYSRYHVLNSWNKVDFKDMALPPCHLLYQFIVRPIPQYERDNLVWNSSSLNDLYRNEAPKKYEEWNVWYDEHNVPKYYLDLNMYQRSGDVALGIPYNLASMSLLLMIIAKTVNMIPSNAFWIGGDTHIYKDHINELKVQLDREPYDLPQLVINKELNSLDDILNLSIDDFQLIDYKSHSKLKFELFVGL